MSDFWAITGGVVAVAGLAVVYIRLSNNAAVLEADKNILKATNTLLEGLNDDYVPLRTYRDEFRPDLERRLNVIEQRQASLDDRLNGIDGWLRDFENRMRARRK